MSFTPSAPYLSPKWVHQIEKYYGQFCHIGKEKHRKPTKRIALSKWLNKHSLTLDILGDSISLGIARDETDMPDLYSTVLYSRCSGGTYTTLISRTSAKTKQEKCTEQIEASIETILAGLQNRVDKLNSPDAENIIIASNVKAYNNKTIRTGNTMNEERWSTSIVLDEYPNNLITMCAKECLRRRIPMHIKGISKYIPVMDDLLAIAKPEFIVGSLAEEYYSTALLRTEKTTTLNLF